MKKLLQYPFILTFLLFLYLEAFGILAGWISYQAIIRVPGLAENIFVNYINMLLTEGIPFLALMWLCRKLFANLKEREGQDKRKLPFYVFLPIIVQIGWDISSLFLEKITLQLFSLKGIIFVVLCFIATVFIGLLEETVWRRIVFGEMLYNWESKKLGVFKAAAASSLLFGLVHYINVLTGGQDFASTTMQVIQSVGMGLFLSAVYYVSNSFTLVVLLHGICNFSNFFCNEMVGWEYAGYWWDAPCKVVFTVLYYVMGVYLLKRVEKFCSQNV